MLKSKVPTLTTMETMIAWNEHSRRVVQVISITASNFQFCFVSQFLALLRLNDNRAFLRKLCVCLLVLITPCKNTIKCRYLIGRIQFILHVFLFDWVMHIEIVQLVITLWQYAFGASWQIITFDCILCSL